MKGVLPESRAAADADLSCDLRGRTVAFAGRLATISRAQAIELVTSRGGRWSDSVTRETAMLVVGLNGWPLRADGRVSGKLRRANRLRQAGAAIEIVREDDFLQRLGLAHVSGAVCRRYTLDQVAKVSGVPVQQVRSWMRAGLIEPADESQGIPQFEFREISAVRKLDELTAAGVTATRLRQSLRQLETLLPDARHWLAQLEMFAQGRRLVARSPDGSLMQPDGQKLFDFGEPVAEPAIRFQPPPLDADELFQRALELEERAHYTDAVATYRHWLLTFGPDSQVCFNLANSLYSLGQHEAAAERYRQAVEIDPDYVEAWSNLGCALAEMDESEEAIAALQRAVESAPHYHDARYNLADVLDKIGRCAEARVHWQIYLEHDQASPWADYARSRLEQIDR